MHSRNGVSSAQGSPWRWRVLALVLIVGAAALRLAFLATACPLDLSPDEAHYWDWSRHPDWSYYSKGPLVAYLIRAGCAVAGGWSERLTASQMVAVRLPAVACGAFLLLSLYVLTVQVFGRERLALAVVALASTLPLLAAGSSLMTIDAPYACCWGWALVLGHRAVFRGSAWAWPAAGAVVGVGILAKYTMVLWLPAVGLFLLTTPSHRRLLFRPGFWALCGVASLACVPILVWNWQHDWATFRHVGGQAGVTNGPPVRWLGPLDYVAVQCGLLLGFWFVAWLAAMTARRPWASADAGLRYLWWTSGFVFAFFLAFSFKTKVEPNWPVTAYLSGMVLTAGWLAEQFRSGRMWVRRLVASGLLAACALGLAATAAVHRADWLQPVLLRVSGPATEARPLPLRRFDPTCRLRGWRTLAAEVDRVRADLGAEGTEPVLLGTSWTVPGELGFYCVGHPTVYCVGPVLGERYSQYDFWGPNPVRDADQFLGRTMIVVGEFHPLLGQAFDTVEDTRSVVYTERSQPVARWQVTVCRGFRGFRWLATAAGSPRW